MPTPTLATKLYIPPLRPKVVRRPHLVERLNAGLAAGCKLTLISASAGFGKTTLLSEWIQTARQGDKETGRQGDRETGRQEISCLPVSLSPNHFLRGL